MSSTPDGADGSGRADGLIDRSDALVPPAPEPGNAVLVDDSRVVRWAAPLFATCAVLLLPWIVFLGLTLPERQLSDNYALAWTGYDALLLASLFLTGYFAIRRSANLTIASSAAGTLLLADAWFDVLTSPGGRGLVEAIAMCVLVEVPLAVMCYWLAAHTQEICERRVVLLQRRLHAQSPQTPPVAR